MSSGIPSTSSWIRRAADGAEKQQISLYLLALLAAAGFALVTPQNTSQGLEHAIEPVLALLLLATFLQVPFLDMAASLRDLRFLGAVLGLNFVVAPLVVWLLVQFLPDDHAVLIGVLLVLLTPCIDYVIVFAGLAGGAADRLVAAAPLLMLLQLVLLPGYLYLFVGSDLASIVEPGPFLRAFGILIALPLTVAAVTQVLSSRFLIARHVEGTLSVAMVPLMMATLFVVVASQVGGVRGRLGDVAAVVPVFAAWFVLMGGAGVLLCRLTRLDVPRSRAVVFSGATRNSLVVLPLALALPDAYALASIVVVTQTLVELIAMVVFVRLVPAVVRPGRRSRNPAAPHP